MKLGTPVLPTDSGDLEVPAGNWRSRLRHWVHDHAVLASVAITLLILGVIAAIVVPITCSVHGCPAKAKVAQRSSLYENAPTRLVVAFLNNVDVQSIVPPILRNYTTRIQLALSNLQVLEAVDEGTLEYVLNLIQERTDVEFLVRDFVMKVPDELQNSILSGRRLLQNDPDLPKTWWFNNINVTGAWAAMGLSGAALDVQNSDVVIGVTDSGCDWGHPDLLPTLWTNPDETDGDGVDNDNNTLIDDVYGACFGGPACPLGCARCGIGAGSGIRDVATHGTKMAGVVAAAANNGVGFAGVAPMLRHMVLKVTDDNYGTYAYSDVVRAVDYGYSKGVRVFAMSFGPDARRSNTDANRATLATTASAYSTLFKKYDNALFVAAAGNENTDLNNWRSGGYTYSPCMVDAPNVLCVGATMPGDGIFTLQLSNQVVGTNWGSTTVDVGAPGAFIWTTQPQLNGGYANVSGTSFATPMAAAVAGLALAALGGASQATSRTPADLKNILMTSGDVAPELTGRFRSNRRLNAARAVEAAQVLARQGRTVVRRSMPLEAAAAAAVSLYGFEYTALSGIPSDYAFDGFGWNFFDQYIRNNNDANASNPIANFGSASWRYVSNILIRVTSNLRVTTAGAYTLQVSATNIDRARWQLSVGENLVVWNVINATHATASLLMPETGYYNFTLMLYPSSSSTFQFRWATPTNPAFTNPSAFYQLLRMDGPTVRNYDPNAAPKPALFHVVWNEASDWSQYSAANSPMYFALNNDTQKYRTQSTTLPDFAFANGAAIKTALYGSVAPAFGDATVVVGYARTNLRPQALAAPVSFRLRGAHTRLFVDGQMLLDNQNDDAALANPQASTACITLQPNVPHEIYLWFAARLSAVNSLNISWVPCTAADKPGLNNAAWTSMAPSIAANFFFAPASIADLPRGMRCDAYAMPLMGNNDIRPQNYSRSPSLSFVLPRDCLPAYRTASGECIMNFRLQEMFPTLTWESWTIRCYTYWAGGPTGGQAVLFNLAGASFIRLAGNTVFESTGNGVTYRGPFAPVASRLGAGVYQSFAAEWVVYGTLWNLLTRHRILDGTLSATNTSAALVTNSATMVLPASANVAMYQAPVIQA